MQALCQVLNFYRLQPGILAQAEVCGLSSWTMYLLLNFCSKVLHYRGETDILER